MSMTDRITEVLRKHRWASIGTGDYRPGAYKCQGCGKLSNKLSEHEAHVAERIAELFTEERHTFADYETEAVSGGEGAFRYGGQTSHYLSMKTMRRWVSNWIADD